MQIKTIRYHFITITWANFFLFEHRGVGTIVEQNELFSQRWEHEQVTVKYGLWLHLTGTHTMFSNAPPGYNPWSSSRSTRAIPFSCNTKTLFALFILILSWVCSEISQRLIRYITEDCRNKWESGSLLLIQTLKDFQKCKSHPLPLKIIFFCFGK